MIMLWLIPIVKSPVVVDIERATTYNAQKSQCDSDPFGTADGSRIDLVKLRNKEIRWVAMSRDLIYDEFRQNNYPREGHWNGQFNFGDTILVSSVSSPQVNGEWVVHDCMNARYSKSIDFLFDATNNKPKLGVCQDVKVSKRFRIIRGI